MIANMATTSFALLLALSLLLPCPAPAEQLTATAAEVVTVDFASDAGPVNYRASGFLHAMTPTMPDLELIAPLKPKLFRNRAEGPGGAFAIYPRVNSLGARSQVVVSDSYWDRKWPETESNWKRWEATVEDLVEEARRNRCTFEWDIWNEPDDEYFWEVDQARFLETWRRTALKIRELDPKAVIVGPSIAHFTSDYMEAFLVYAKANDVLPDILTWHELDSEETPDSVETAGFNTIEPHAAEVRRLLAKHDIPIDRLCLNEIIGPGMHPRPGAAVRYFAALERANVDGACHATWREPEGGNYASLSGILTREERKPRSTWWAYKAYADITGRLVSVTPGATVDGVAGHDPATGEARILLGRCAEGDRAISLRLRLTHLDAALRLPRDGAVHVTAERIPMSSWDALEKPLAVFDADQRSAGGALDLKLSDFGPNDAYIITLRAGGRT